MASVPATTPFPCLSPSPSPRAWATAATGPSSATAAAASDAASDAASSCSSFQRFQLLEQHRLPLDLGDLVGLQLRASCLRRAQPPNLRQPLACSTVCQRPATRGQSRNDTPSLHRPLSRVRLGIRLLAGCCRTDSFDTPLIYLEGYSLCRRSVLPLWLRLRHGLVVIWLYPRLRCLRLPIGSLSPCLLEYILVPSTATPCTIGCQLSVDDDFAACEQQYANRWRTL